MNRSAVFLDLDKTITSMSSEKAFGFFLLKKGKLGLGKVLKIIWTYLLYDLNIIRNYDECKKSLLMLIMDGRSVEEMEGLAESFFHKELKHSLYTEIIEEIHRHRSSKRRVVIVSAAIDLIVQRIADFLKIDDFFATTLEILDGKYTGQTGQRIHYGPAKALAVQEYCDLHTLSREHSWAYGDHIEDRHMLESVGTPIAVNPDKKLRVYAIQNQWMIKDLKNNVRQVR